MMSDCRPLILTIHINHSSMLFMYTTTTIIQFLGLINSTLELTLYSITIHYHTCTLYRCKCSAYAIIWGVLSERFYVMFGVQLMV